MSANDSVECTRALRKMVSALVDHRNAKPGAYERFRETKRALYDAAPDDFQTLCAGAAAEAGFPRAPSAHLSGRS